MIHLIYIVTIGFMAHELYRQFQEIQELNYELYRMKKYESLYTIETDEETLNNIEKRY